MERNRSVLAAVDFSPGSRRALSEAVRICKTFGGRLHVIHVVECRVVDTLADLLQKSAVEARQEALEKARAALTRLVRAEDAPPDTRLHLTVGAPVPEILACVEDVEPGLLVLGERDLSRTRIGAGPLSSGDPGGVRTRVLLVNED